MKIAFTPESAVLKVSGEATRAFNRQLRAAVGKALSLGHFELTVDLREFEVINSATLGAFSDAARIAKGRGGRVRFILPEAAKRIATIVGLPLAA